MNTAAAFADFRTYPLISALSGVQALADRVLATWLMAVSALFIINGCGTIARARNASTQ